MYYDTVKHSVKSLQARSLPTVGDKRVCISKNLLQDDTENHQWKSLRLEPLVTTTVIFP